MLEEDIPSGDQVFREVQHFFFYGCTVRKGETGETYLLRRVVSADC